jgi:tumor protein p53-inducible protein 3
MALVSGGAYGEYLKVKRSHVMKLPEKLTFQEAAAVTEAWLTAYQIIRIGKIKENMNVAINAATGSVGSAAIQICGILKANPYVIVTSADQI